MNTQVREEAAAWLIEFRTEEVDAATRERFADWLRASPAHVSAYLKVASIWEDAADRPPERDLEALIRLARADGGNVVPLQEARAWSDAADLGTPGSAADAEFTRQQIAMSAKPSLRRRYAFTAAAIAAVSTTAVWFALTRDPVYGTQLGEQRMLELADGSTVELNALSSIRVQLRKAERRVELLSGQALFSVIHDAARPFVVVSGEAHVEDVGTRFAVARGLTATVVTVIEGRVAVRKDGDAAADAHDAAALKVLSEESASRPGSAATIVPVVLVSAGEQVSVASGAVSRPHRANVATATAWTQQQLVFESTPLSEAADAFNRFNARQLRIEGAALADFHVSGTFPARDPTSLSRFVLFLRAQPGIEVQESGGEISVRPK